MWATLSPSTNRLLLAGWAVFAGLNVVLMWLLPGQETVAFHFVWISLALVYGFTTWRVRWMVVALAAVVVSTGAVLAHHAAIGEIRWEETTEEPLMTAVFVVMVWHVHRRQLLLREVQRINLVERHRLERQQLFVRLASHELRTPITVARGYTELLRDAHPDPAAVEDAGVVLEELDKLGRITQRLVTLMQLDQPHPMRRFDMDAELFRTVRRWAPTADRVWTVESAIGDARANTERFEAALDCLVENAIKFTGPGDRIAVRGGRVRDGWTVEVFDSGAGIAADDAHAALTGPPGRTTATGTGLGLAIVRAVAESLGGRLEIAPAPGGGTCARLCVPQPPLPAEPARLTGQDSDPSPAPRRVAPPIPSSA